MAGEKCRICLQEGNFDSIFRVKGSLMLSTKIMSLANVVIYPNDGLPSTICFTCTEKLENCIGFIKLCKKSDFHLRLDSNDIENINSGIVNKDNGIDGKIHETKYPSNVNMVHNLSNEKIFNFDEKPIDKTDFKYKDKKCISESRRSQKQQCFTCGKVMSSRFRLKTHLRTHTGERPFSCSHCNKNFSLAQNLKVHLRIHTGEKPFSCTICGETFAHSGGLTVHRRKHTGLKPYQCILCPRNFRTIGHLQYHIRRHTGAKNFECCTCGRAFITRSDLKQHSVTHSGEKPHVCCICGMRLTRASHLKRHIRFIHENDKQTSSEVCPDRSKNGKMEKVLENSKEISS